MEGRRGGEGFDFVAYVCVFFFGFLSGFLLQKSCKGCLRVCDFGGLLGRHGSGISGLRVVLVVFWVMVPFFLASARVYESKEGCIGGNARQAWS